MPKQDNANPQDVTPEPVTPAVNEADQSLTEQFLDMLWIERNLAENTLSSYRQDLKSLLGWLHHNNTDLLHVSAEDLQLSLIHI